MFLVRVSETITHPSEFDRSQINGLKETGPLFIEITNETNGVEAMSGDVGEGDLKKTVEHVREVQEEAE